MSRGTPRRECDPDGTMEKQKKPLSERLVDALKARVVNEA
jgi:hypothetical protein